MMMTEPVAVGMEPQGSSSFLLAARPAAEAQHKALASTVAAGTPMRSAGLAHDHVDMLRMFA